MILYVYFMILYVFAFAKDMRVGHVFQEKIGRVKSE